MNNILNFNRFNQLNEQKDDKIEKIKDILNSKQGVINSQKAGFNTVKKAANQFNKNFADKIVFKQGSDDLDTSNESTQKAIKALDTVVGIINKHKEYVKDIKLKITGYASKEGDESTNKTLSENRAKSIANMIAKNTGMKVLHRGLGETDKFAKGDTPEALAANRRILIEFDSSAMSLTLPKGVIYICVRDWDEIDGDVLKIGLKTRSSSDIKILSDKLTLREDYHIMVVNIEEDTQIRFKSLSEGEIKPNTAEMVIVSSKGEVKKVAALTSTDKNQAILNIKAQ